MQRVKSFARNKTGDGRLSGLALISIEKQLLKRMRQRMWQQLGFHDRVLEVFLEKERRMDLIFK